MSQFVLIFINEKEYDGYRYIFGIIIAITDKIELDSIRESLITSYKNVKNHMEKALDLFSERTNPDYENTIKECITAVEAMCNILCGAKASLGNALNSLEKNGIVIHGALKQAFEKLYGYTSDADGIRHAGQLGGTSATFNEAKFMLVTCSAFINYLKSVSAACNISEAIDYE